MSTFTPTQVTSTNGTILTQYPAQLVEGVAEAARVTRLLSGLLTNDVGQWIPNTPFSRGNFEVSIPVGDSWPANTTTTTVQLLASNDEDMPPNGWAVTLGGSFVAGHVLSISINSEHLQNVIGSYIVPSTGSPDATSCAAGLAAALVAALKAVNPLNAGAEAATAAGYVQVSAASGVISIYTSQPFEHLSLLTGDSGTTETMTVAQYDSGLGFVVGAPITEPGITALDGPYRWLKANVTLYDGVPVPITGILDQAYP